MKRTIVAAVTAVSLLSGCDTAFKYENYVQSLYKGGAVDDTVTSSIKCYCEMSETFKSAVNVTRRQSSTMEINNDNYECEMNPRVPFEIFSKQTKVSAQSPILSKILENRHLKIAPVFSARLIQICADERSLQPPYRVKDRIFPEHISHIHQTSVQI